MIINGKEIAEEIVSLLERERASLPPVLKLGFVMGEGDEASASFVRIKERIANRLQVVVIKEEIKTTKDALASIGRLTKSTNGIIVQLPLPAGVDTDAVLTAVPKEKDIDFSNPPVAAAIEEVLKRSMFDFVSGTRAVVVGYGRLVGQPAAELLKKLGAEVTVLQADDSLEPLKQADIVVLGAGSPGLIKPGMLKQGVVLIDAGTSESNGKLAGDASPACAEVASVFTPVPGGIGPIAVALIFKNLFDLTRQGQ